MSNKVKDIDIKIRIYYFFNDDINTKTFDPNKVRIDNKSYKNHIKIFSYLLHWICNNERLERCKN